MDIKSPVAEARNDYTYSADGRKLKVVQKCSPNHSTTPVLGSAVTVGNLTQTKTTDYAGNKIYENNVLKRTLIEGGYIEGSTYYYYLTDHLGNNRVVATGTNTVTQKNHYYPFGMTFGEVANTEQGVQPYKYNGKELDRTHGLNWYDYSARHYDAAVGRFMTMDPLAEEYYSISPYAYCNNNPMRFVDPTGMNANDTIINAPQLSEVIIVGQKVAEPISGFWSSLSYYLLGRTHTTPVYGTNSESMYSQPIGHITYNVDKQGYTTGVAPKGGIGPTPSKTTVNAKSLKALMSLNPLKLGSTGRSIANNLNEQLAMKEILANPALGKIIMQNMTDTRWSGWSKMQYVKTLSNGENIVIHYVAKVKNNIILAIDDFKFK